MATRADHVGSYGLATRHVLVAMCAVGIFICYIDRVNISVAIIPMAEQFGWSGTTNGFVLSSFFIGYMVAMLPTGWLSNRYGGRLLMGVALLAWSFFTFITPVAAAFSFSGLIAARILMGMGEAASFPAVYNLFARWLPKAEKSRSVAIALAGIPAGTVFALLTTGWLVQAYGWPSVFYAFGGLGIAFALLWLTLIHQRPADHPRISLAEEALLTPLDAACDTANQPVPWRRLFTHRAVWAVVINHFCANWTLYLMLAWLPSYFRDAQHMSIANSGLFAVAPWITQFVVSNIAATFADRAIASGTSVTTVRRWTQCTGLLGGAACFLLASQATTPLYALVCMCGALGFGGTCFSGFACNHLDIAPRYADILWSISNTAGTLPGIIGVAATGILLDLTGGYTATFVVAAIVNLIGAAVWLSWSTGEQVFD